MKKILTLFAIIVVSCTLWAGNVITYTAPTKLVETTNTNYSGLHTDAFNVGIASHTFENGIGTIVFAGDVTSVGDYAFNSCTNLTSIEIPNSVLTLGICAFSGCGLTTLSIPESVTSIGHKAFFACSGLSSIIIPKNVASIDEQAFSLCSVLSSVVVEPENTTYDSRDNCNAIVETASNSLVFGCNSTIIPSSVTSIGRNAFLGCLGLTAITIPSSVTIIEDEAFPYTGLISVTIPNSVISIGYEAFRNNYRLTSLVIGNSVTNIGNGAFSGCSELTSLTIPNSVTSIGDKAFYDCQGLISVVVESGNAIYDSRNDCNAIIETASNTLIYGCQNTVIPESITSIGNSAFGWCTGLTLIEIPEGVTSIGNSAFSCCSNLVLVTIPNSVKSVENWAFESCRSMMSVTIPAGLISIGEGAFYGCSGLSSMIVEPENTVYDSRENCNAIVETATNTLIYGCRSTIVPESVTSIETKAFYQCYALTNVTIPNGVTRIGAGAFSDCFGLANITCEAVIPPVLGSAVFSGVSRNIPLYVPAASIPLYLDEEQWNEFDIQPLVIHVDPITPNTTELTWEPVDSASLYQLHLYTDWTSGVALDTMLLINADSLNGGIMLQNGASVARRVKKIIQDAGGTIIVITIDPTSGTSEENPYKVTVSTVSGERVDVHFDMKVFQGTEILREESGTFVLNDNQPDGIQNTLAPSLPTGIYDLYGHRYPAAALPSLPAGVYVLRDGEKMTKVMRK